VCVVVGGGRGSGVLKWAQRKLRVQWQRLPTFRAVGSSAIIIIIIIIIAISVGNCTWRLLQLSDSGSNGRQWWWWRLGQEVNMGRRVAFDVLAVLTM
jgi:hypothetical protein